MNNKKLKTSKVTIGLYACTGIVSVYALYAIFNSITYLRNYFKTYGSSIGEHFGDALSYILNQSLSYIVFAVLLFAASVILTEVRKLNPENYISEGELQALAAAKAEKAAKAAEAKAMKEAEKAAKEASKVETATVETPKLGEAAVKEEVEEIAEKVAEEVIESK
nr:hypothetical protein [uncultured Mogibacterium sp.]